MTWNKYIADYTQIKPDDSFAFWDYIWIMRFIYEMDKRKREEWVIIEGEQYIIRSLSSSSECGIKQNIEFVRDLSWMIWEYCVCALLVCPIFAMQKSN